MNAKQFESKLLDLITEITELRAENKILKSVNDRLLQALPIHGVMQAEGSAGAVGAAVASEGVGEANTCAGYGSCKGLDRFCGCKYAEHFIDEPRG